MVPALVALSLGGLYGFSALHQRMHEGGQAAALYQTADELMDAVSPGSDRFQLLPPFAQARLEWLFHEWHVGRLELAVEDRREACILEHGALMAPTTRHGARGIVVVRARLIELLREGHGHEPYSSEQVNHFAVELTHEAMHLQAPQLAADVSTEAAVWRDLTVNVVRPLRAVGQSVHASYIAVDDRSRTCGAESDCWIAALRSAHVLP